MKGRNPPVCKGCRIFRRYCPGLLASGAKFHRDLANLPVI
jgi:hypothetical protein